MQNAWGPRVAWLEAVIPSPPALQQDSMQTSACIHPTALQQCGALLPAPGWPEMSPLPSESIQEM